MDADKITRKLTDIANSYKRIENRTIEIIIDKKEMTRLFTPDFFMLL